MDLLTQQDQAFQQQLSQLPDLGSSSKLAEALKTQSSGQRNLQKLALALLLTDYAQTSQIANNPDQFHENNALLGRHPSSSRVNAYFGANLLGNILLNSHNPKLGSWLNAGTIGIETPMVMKNMNLGLKP